MAFHSHGEKPFEAQRVFTDREEPVALFEQAFAEAQEPGDHRVICWHGVGGQGKSSLHDEIRRRIAGNPDVALAGLDFDVPRHRRLEDAMLKLRGDLAGRGLSFPTFDLAFARHFALERPGENIRQVHPQLYRRGESQIVDDMLDWSEAGVDLAVEGISTVVPGLNLLYRYGARLTGRLGDWWSSRTVKGKLAGLDQLSTSKLGDRLPQYLGFDIWRARAEIGCPRIVITIDTHEKLGNGELRGDAWLQTLVRETPGALILLFGRDRLRWAELDDRWKGVLLQRPLEELSDRHADHFLSQVPIPEDDIRTRIINSAKGLPHYLNLAVSLYEDIRNAGETPKLEDFGTTPAEVRERFLDHLPPEERHELFLASYPESLSERLFLDLTDAFLGGAGNVNWTRLDRRSFMTEGSDGRLVMHALMREALQDQDQVERPNFFARVHERLFERYAARARVPDALSVTPEAERALLAASDHAAWLGRDQAFKWAEEAHEPFLVAARWRVLERVCADTLQQFTEPSAYRAWLLGVLAHSCLEMARNDEAEKLYKQVLAIERTTLGEAHTGYAVTLHNLACVRHEMGRYSEAEGLFVQALGIIKTALGEAHPECIPTMCQLAHCRLMMGRNTAAEELFEQALGITRSALGETHLTYGTIVHNLARVRQAMGRYAEAEALCEQALEIKKAVLGEAHPGYAATLHELARARQAMGHGADSEALYMQALEIMETALGEAHPLAILSLASLAGCRACLGRVAAARNMIESALAQAQTLSEDATLWTGRVRLRWAHGLLGAGLEDEAIIEARAARELLAEALGPEAALVREADKLIADSGAEN